jgi:hypothetical protein
MTRHFTSNQLTYLRNQVPLARVIEALPDLETRHADGKLRFGCPVCHGFNTCINAEANLGRCFDCRKNFNPIELVMCQRQISFVESVKWLLQRSADKSATGSGATGTVSTQPAAVGDILAGMLAVPSDRKTEPLPAETIPQRISHLEQNVRSLYRLIDELRSSIVQK